MLGHVDIHRDASKPFAPDAWTTRRARDIFCYIATARHRRVDKDVLIDTFWADEDLDAVEKNFHPTISHIRKALNSRQSFKQNYLVFRDGAYQLNPELAYSIDTEEFEAHIAAAEEAKREKDAKLFRASLESAHALYRGEFMAGAYEDWAEERRHYFSEQFSRVLSALAKLSFPGKKLVERAEIRQRGLEGRPIPRGHAPAGDEGLCRAEQTGRREGTIRKPANDPQEKSSGSNRPPKPGEYTRNY